MCVSVVLCVHVSFWTNEFFCQIPLIISIGWPLSNYSYYQSLRPHSPCSVHLILKCDIERLDLINFFCHTSQAVLCAKVLNKGPSGNTSSSFRFPFGETSPDPLPPPLCFPQVKPQVSKYPLPPSSFSSSYSSGLNS